MNKKDIIWKDRKRTIFGLPWTFTVYKLTGEKILIDTGFFNQREEEVMLFRITETLSTEVTRERKENRVRSGELLYDDDGHVE